MEGEDGESGKEWRERMVRVGGSGGLRKLGE